MNLMDTLKTKRAQKTAGYIGSAVLVVMFIAWAAPQLMNVYDMIGIGKLERVNVIMHDKYFGEDPDEKINLETVDANIEVHDGNLFVRFKGEERQQQWFPDAGIMATLASVEISSLLIDTAKAQEPKKKRARCVEKAYTNPATGEPLMSCIYPDGCIELYRIDPATGQITEYVSARCN